MKKEKWIWALCEGCASPYCTLGEFKGKDPFVSVPENRKCGTILSKERKKWEIRSKLLSARCRHCGFDCPEPKIRTGEGGSLCEKKNGGKFKGQVMDNTGIQKVFNAEIAR